MSKIGIYICSHLNSLDDGRTSGNCEHLGSIFSFCKNKVQNSSIHSILIHRPEIERLKHHPVSAFIIHAIEMRQSAVMASCYDSS